MRLFLLFFFIVSFCFSQTNDHAEQYRDSLIDVGLKHYSNRNVEAIRESISLLSGIYNKSKDSMALAKVYHFKALIHRINYKLDSSYSYYHLSKDVSKRIGDSIEVGKRLLSMCYMQKDEKDYVGAEQSIVEGLRYLEPLQENLYTGHSLNALGHVLTKVNRYNEAREYYNRALQKYQNLDSRKLRKRNALEILNNKGNTFLLERKPREALAFFEKALEFDSIKENHFSVYKRLFVNAAESKYALGQKDEAWDDFHELMNIRKSENDDFGLSLSHNGFAHYYLLEGKREKALFHAKKGYDYARKVSNNLTYLSALVKLVNLTSGSELKSYFNEYVSLNDSLSERERYFKNQFAKVRFETEKKDKENAELILENNEKQAQIERDQLQMIILILVGIIVVVVLVMYYSNRRKKLMYEAQLSKASAREEERQQIAKSLHDEVAGDLRMLHRKLAKTDYQEEANNLDKIKENVRNLSHQLSSVSFDEVSFKDQIINLVADNFSLDFRISVEGIDAVLWETVNSAIKRTLYLCARESLQNTLKYAEASKFFISFSSEKKEILLHLKDNGKGFDLKKGKKGIGLKNLKERVEEIQGSFHIETSEQGTKTTISIPINGR